MDRLIEIDGKKVGFRATALTPRLYRHWRGRDVLVDIAKLNQAMLKAKDEDLSIADLEVFEDLAWVMAKQYDKDVPETPEEWLDTFDTFLIYDILPEIIDLWAENQVTTSESKKK